jgi:2-iminobutanoate/2-iminopropanoate deaminase
VREPIVSPRGARPRGPYTPAILAEGKFLFVSSQGPIDPATDQVVNGSFAEKARQVLDNVTVLLEAAGAGWEDVVKVQLFLADMANFAEFNEIYKEYVKEPYPARTTVPVNLGANGLVVDCVARVK